MRGSTVQVRILGGMQQTLPQEIEHATLIENMTLDEDTQAYSSRVGYERYRPALLYNHAPAHQNQD